MKRLSDCRWPSSSLRDAVCRCLFLCALWDAGGPGEDGGQGEGRAGAGHAEETFWWAQVLPEQRGSQGVTGFCDPVNEFQ